MSELEQWCEIDGHQWVECWLEYGLVLGPKSCEMTRTCTFCRTEEVKFFIPAGSRPFDVYSL